jgi:hypothetical protein
VWGLPLSSATIHGGGGVEVGGGMKPESTVSPKGGNVAADISEAFWWHGVRADDRGLRACSGAVKEGRAL